MYTEDEKSIGHFGETKHGPIIYIYLHKYQQRFAIAFEVQKNCFDALKYINLEFYYSCRNKICNQLSVIFGYFVVY